MSTPTVPVSPRPIDRTATLSPRALAALRLLEDAGLDVLPSGRAWQVVDGGDLMAEGVDLDAAVTAALPLAADAGMVARADVAALDEGDAPDWCGWCSGSGEGASERHVCRHCKGTGSARRAS